MLAKLAKKKNLLVTFALVTQASKVNLIYLAGRQFLSHIGELCLVVDSTGVGLSSLCLRVLECLEFALERLSSRQSLRFTSTTAF